MVEYQLGSEPHRVLCVPELLLHCFEYLSRSELVIALLVCKGWSASLDVLWREREVPLSVIIDKLSQLIESELPQSDQITSPLAFFEEFAQKITQLDVNQDITTETAEILAGISSALGTHLFPNMTALMISESSYFDTESSPWFESFITDRQQITSIAFENYTDLDELQPLLSALGRAAPYTQQLALEEDVAGWLEIDCSVFKQLRVAYLRDFAPEKWRPLVEGCCFLEKVVISVTDDEYPSDGPFPGPPLVSYSLRELNVQWKEYGYALATTIMPNLHILAVGDLSGDTDITTFLGKHSPALQHLEITYSNGEVGDTALEGISNLKELRTIHLSGGVDSILFSDSAIDFLARSLQHLEQLSLQFEDYAGAPILLTGNSLNSILRHCPGLKILELSLNLLDFQPDLTEVAPSRIWSLSIYEVTLPDDEVALKGIAKHLVAWCPKLEKLGRGPDLWKNRDRKTSEWERLAELFRFYQGSNTVVPWRSVYTN
ncbi:hypothetical protein FRB94_007805 [Tulasnella sp. JGI-2019a]|nr:hypothetical protein FRB94_007805 [Tulasnella sp. JGI-2019a]KAG9020636.1 hypothetical protein FRB95_003838 [Tulasnella sp. JGI-2019a]